MRTPEERRDLAKRFHPDQPRWPKGSGDKSGEWMDVPGVGSIKKPRKKAKGVGLGDKYRLGPDHEKNIRNEGPDPIVAGDMEARAARGVAARRAAARRAPKDDGGKSELGSWARVREEAQVALADAEQKIREGKIKARQHYDSGTSFVQRVTLEDGTHVMHKDPGVGESAQNDTAAEVIGAELARAMGLRAPAVRRTDVSPDSAIDHYRSSNYREGEGSHHILMEYVDGMSGSEHAIDQYDYHGVMDAKERAYKSDEGKKIGLLDTIIQNMDRHDGNWMVDKEGNIVPIDHGNSFFSMKSTVDPKWDLYHPSGVKPPPTGWYAPASPFAAHARLFTTERGIITGWLKQDYFSKADIKKLRAVVEKLKPEFDKLAVPSNGNRTEKYEAVMDRLAQLEKHATGKVNRL